MTISFNEIPQPFFVPSILVEFDPSRASSGPALEEFTALIIAQKLSGGSATANAVVQVPNEDEADALFGAGSMAARMVKAFRKRNAFTDLHVIPVADDAGGTAATGSVAFSGTATAPGTVTLYIAGTRITAAVAVGDAAATVAAAVHAAIAATSGLPLTSAVSTATVNLTARHKGLNGNAIDVRLNYQPTEKLPAGITATVTAMASGATNPALTNAIAAMADTPYKIIAFPYTDATSLAAIEAELAARWGPVRAIEGVAFTAQVNTVGNLQTLGDSRNSAFVSILGLEPFPGVPEERAAAVAAQVALKGQADPARPFQTLDIDGLAPALADRFTLAERNLLLSDGISTMRVAPGDQVQIERLCTTRTKNAQGSPDLSLYDVNTVLTLGYLRFSWRARLSSRFPRHKLAAKLSAADVNQAVLTPTIAKAEAAAWYQQLQDELVLVEDLKGFLADSVFEINASDPNQLDMLLAPRLVNQFRVAATQIQFRR